MARLLKPPPVYNKDKLVYTIEGASLRRFTDVYHWLLRIGWGRLLALSALFYVVANVIFAGLYLAGGDCIANARPGHPMDAFWFSIQTFSTIGYGTMGPRGLYANVLVTVESYVGLVSVAVGTGLLFAKFSRPTARVRFADVAVVHPRNGVPCLHFRMANERRNQIMEARLSVSVLVDETTEEGDQMRRFYDLALQRSHTPIFSLTWTAIHVLDEASPLFGLSAGTLDASLIGVVVGLTGIDDTFSQTVVARKIYQRDALRFGERYVDVVHYDASGHMTIRLSRLSQTEPAR